MFTAFNGAFRYNDAEINTPGRIDFNGVCGVPYTDGFGQLHQIEGDASLDIASGVIDFYNEDGEQVHTIRLCEQKEERA